MINPINLYNKKTCRYAVKSKPDGGIYVEKKVFYSNTFFNYYVIDKKGDIELETFSVKDKPMVKIK